MMREHGSTVSALRFDPPRTHLWALAALVAVVALRWAPWLGSPEPLFDEAIYLDAFEASVEGVSPSSVPGYYYPPPFALLGGWLLSVLGRPTLMLLFRFAIVLGLVGTVWLSLVWWRVSATQRVIVAAIYLCLAPAVGLGIRTGNVSFLVVGCIVAALMVWQSHPMGSGLVLGASVSIKPLAPVAIFALLTHRPFRVGHQHLVAGLVGTATMFLSLVPLESFERMLSQNIASLSKNRSFSLHRLLELGGVDAHPLLAMTMVALVTGVVCRWRRMGDIDLLCVALTGAICAVPLIWTHTLLLTLPVQIIALVRAFGRRRRVEEDAAQNREVSGLRRYEIWLVVLAVAAIQLAEGSGAVDRASAWIQIVALGLPYLAPVGLTAYILSTSVESAATDAAV